MPYTTPFTLSLWGAVNTSSVGMLGRKVTPFSFLLAALSHTAQLMGAVVQYAKTRPVFDGYKAARYSKKYLAQHEAELSDYRAAKAAMSDLLGGAKLPKMDALKKQRRELAEKKKALYAEYRKAQADMREAVAVKGNIDCLLGHTDERNKAQER